MTGHHKKKGLSDQLTFMEQAVLQAVFDSDGDLGEAATRMKTTNACITNRLTQVYEKFHLSLDSRKTKLTQAIIKGVKDGYIRI